MGLKKMNFKSIAYGVGIFILVIIVIRFQQRISEMNHLEGQLVVIQEQGTQVMQTQVSLLTQVSYATSDEAVKAWAYNEGRWYLPNETPIMILPVGNTTPTVEGEGVQPTPGIQNWKVWWELFFGKKN